MKKSKTITKRTTRVPKTRNANTMTEAQFYSMLRSALRGKSRFWKPILNCKLKARRVYKGNNKKQKWEYQCAECKEWFMEKEISVDHIIPAGSLRCTNDLPGFVERLFCEVDKLQCLCNSCHLVKTLEERK
jgi:hypothetical protein